MRQLVSDIGNETVLFGELAKVPNDRVRNFRNDLYLVSEALRLMKKSGNPALASADWEALGNYKKHVDRATRFIPSWVKVAVALALGLGTMVGWKRIVMTVAEKIGKEHLTYGQGAAAEITAMLTIGAADFFGLPVSTTHVLSSGIAGTMAANHSGLQWSTVRNLAMAWVLTLPASMVLAGLWLLPVKRSALGAFTPISPLVEDLASPRTFIASPPYSPRSSIRFSVQGSRLRQPSLPLLIPTP